MLREENHLPINMVLPANEGGNDDGVTEYLVCSFIVAEDIDAIATNHSAISRHGISCR